MAGLSKELLVFERALARLDWSVIELDDVIDDDFVEFGRSGRVWDRAGILAALAGRPNPDIDLEGFRVTLLCADVALATFTTRPDRTLRSSLWVRREGRWRIRFHQGTPMPDAPAGS